MYKIKFPSAGQSTCPPGPGASAPKAGTYSTVPTATAGEVKVLWTTPQDASPQAPARTGYMVSARAKTAVAPSKFVSAVSRRAPLSQVLTSAAQLHCPSAHQWRASAFPAVLADRLEVDVASV